MIVLDLDQFFPSLGPCPCLSGGEFFVVSLLGEVCGGLVIESTSVMGAFGFSLFFVCFSLFVAISMFVSFLAGGFIFADCSYDSIYFLYQCLHFVYKLGNYFRFCACFRFEHFFVTSAYFVASIILLASGYIIFSVCFNLVISFSLFNISLSLDPALWFPWQLVHL